MLGCWDVTDDTRCRDLKFATMDASHTLARVYLVRVYWLLSSTALDAIVSNYSTPSTRVCIIGVVYEYYIYAYVGIICILAS
jgi:hypothetical protein